MYFKNSAKYLCSLIAVAALSGCGGEEDLPDSLLCAALEGTTYYSTTLEESGRTQTGINLGHWRIDFAKGEALMFQSDVGMAGQYQCTESSVELTLDGSTQTLQFNDDLTRLAFNPFGGDNLDYVRSDSLSGNAHPCDLVRGREYTEPEVSVSSEDDNEAVGSAIAFSETGQSVDVRLQGIDGYTGIFECSTGELHIHRDEADTQPVIVNIAGDGAAVEFTSDDLTYRLSAIDNGGGMACIDLYDPVCGIDINPDQCKDDDCPLGVYKTYSNSCYAGLDNAPVVFNDECGELEGQPVEDEATACTLEYAPVCSAVTVTEPCLTAPCPRQVFETFGNRCTSDVADARFLSEGECGDDKEGQEVTDLNGYFACPAVYLPVCGKIATDLECITAPCPTHTYRTFGNSCEAGLSLAGFVSEGECPERLAGEPVTGEPVVVMADELPEPAAGIDVVEAGIEGDVLTVTLSYGGCDPHHHGLTVHNAFMESDPVQVQYRFVPVVNQLCRALLTTEFQYDLTPLKLAYQKAYQTQAGEIVLKGLGTYRFK